MGVRIRALAGMLVVVCVPMLAIVALHRSGTVGPPDRPVGDPVEVMVTEGVRVLALLLAYGLVGTTLAHAAAVATRNGRLLGVTARLTVPAIRRLTEQAVAGSLVVTVLAGPALPMFPAAAAEPETGVAQGNVVDPVAPLVSEDYAPVPYLLESHPSTVEAEEDPPPPERPAPPAATQQQDQADSATAQRAGGETRGDTGEESTRDAPEPAAGSTTVTVTRGDSLWSLSEARMTAHLDRRAGDAEIAPFWRKVVDQNRGGLRSGDPDLIHPGEEIVLPDPGPFSPPRS